MTECSAVSAQMLAFAREITLFDAAVAVARSAGLVLSDIDHDDGINLHAKVEQG